MAMRCLAVLFAPRAKLFEGIIPNVMKTVPVSSFFFVGFVQLSHVCLQASLGHVRFYGCLDDCVSYMHVHGCVWRERWKDERKRLRELRKAEDEVFSECNKPGRNRLRVQRHAHHDTCQWCIHTGCCLACTAPLHGLTLKAVYRSIVCAHVCVLWTHALGFHFLISGSHADSSLTLIVLQWMTINDLTFNVYH